MSAIESVIGKKFGRYTVLCRVGFKAKCRCSCGEERMVYAYDLINGKSKSCGCLRKKILSKLKRKHGYTTQTTQHPIYGAWKGMINRCESTNNKAYKHYGGRGIRVCKRWHTFVNFADDMAASWKRGLSVERKNNDGNYEPSNCKWATMKEQANNRRKPSCHQH